MILSPITKFNPSALAKTCHHEDHEMFLPVAPERDQLDYRLEKCLGGGGMGQVFLATDTRLGETVALKLLRDAFVNDQSMKLRFEWEWTICAALESENIVKVRDYGITRAGYPFYVMEYLPGQTLGQLLTQTPRLSPQQTYSIMAQVCAGLKLAHEGILLVNEATGDNEVIQIIHRDLKPDNIFLVPGKSGFVVKVIDFGIAQIRRGQEDYINTQGFLGTSHYASPEQIEGAKELDQRADIYSLGLILYEMLTGYDAFGFNFRHHQVSVESWLWAHRDRTPQLLRSQPNCDHLSPALEAVVMKCLQKSPDARFSSVQALSEALREAVAEGFGELEERAIAKRRQKPLIETTIPDGRDLN
ncbi:serine/threonine-protein kinase [Crocosphaera sp. UHCC 0190]|uniref:serine/threonine protein kinase n=1 Tax=Crocosphaera sp. UHCC 0190 TaxID=3110246 RepID=UPI002B220F28|nr:serine/threonine-protein kinase [Crocosphaera sp. UHCC 0190]MEA5511589.1 serine/threonine-protein kinase [Crocosphaera sp. UHCC 0190]